MTLPEAIADAALEARGLDELLARVLDLLASSLPVDRAVFFLQEGDLLTTRATLGIESSRCALRVGEGASGLAAQLGEPIALDAANDPRVRASAAQLGVRALLAVPLRHEGRTIGVLTYGSTSLPAFSRADHERMLSLSPRIAAAVALHAAHADALRRAQLQARAADETLRLAAEAAALGTWDWSLVTHELHWSDQTRRIYGLPEGSPISYELYSSMLPPEDRRMLEAAVQSALDPAGPRRFHCEHRILRADGALRWLLGHGRAIFDADDAPVRVLGTTMDVTERRRAADDERFLARASVELARSLDAELTVKRLMQLLVPARGDHASVELHEGASESSPDHPESCHVRISATMRARGRSIGTVTLCRERGAFDEADRTLLGELATRAALAIDNGHLFAEADQARAHAELRREEAQRASRAKDEFLAMLGHELRNPLAPIATAVRVLGPRLPHSRELAIVERQVRHLSRLVDDLLDVSRITAGRVDLELATVDVEHILGRAIEMSSPLIEQGRHMLAVTATGGPLLVRGDETRLAQVFANLLTNSAKYTAPSGHIEIAARREGDVVEVSVRDDGMGIARELLPRVFDLFTQGGQSIDRAAGGLGLGLSIVQSLVAMHHGTVEARSAGPGSGTEMVVRLPACEPLDEPATSVLRARAASPTAALVYLVDDNTDATELLAIALESAGFEVRTFEDGPSVLARLTKQSEVPAVAVLDIGLPVMDGYELAGELKKLLPSLPLVAVTGYGQREDRERSRRAGFDAHLVKPVDLDMLERTLADLAGGRT